IARSKTMGEDSDRPFRELLFGGGSLARDVLGTEESIARLRRDSVMEFYRRWFVPNNMLLFVTGDFAADTMRKWLDGQLSTYRPRELPPRQRLDTPDFADLGAGGIYRTVGTGDQRELKAAWAAPRPGEADYIPFILLNMLLNRRLEIEFPEQVQGGCYIQLDPDLAVFQVNISAPREGPKSEALANNLRQIIQNLVKKPPTVTDINSLALRYRADEVFNSEKLHYYGIMNSGHWALVPWVEFASWGERIGQVKPEQLTAVVQKWLVDSPAVMMALEPPEPQGESSTSTTGRIEKFKLENGLVGVIREDPSARVFALHVLARDRWLWDRKFGAGAVDLLHRLMVQDEPQAKATLNARLDALAASLKTCDDPSIPYDNYYTTPDYSFIRLETLPEFYREGLSLLVERMSKLPFAAECLAAAKTGAGQAAGGSKRSPVGAGRDRLTSRLAPQSGLSAPVYGDVTAITRETLETLRKGYFNPANLIITVSSPLPLDEVKAQITQAFGRPTPDRFQPLERAPFDSASASATAAFAADTLHLGGAQGAVVLGKVLPSIDPAERVALTVANAWFSDLIAMVLREQQGLAYSLGSSVNVLPNREGQAWGYWEISIGTRRENLTQAEDGIRDLLDELVSHEFNDEEVTRLTNALAGRLLMRDMARIGQAYAMGVGEFYWQAPQQRQEFIKEMSTLTGASVTTAAKKYLGKDGFLTVVVE
ncbi:MAG: insulinase family protein, partial [Calditrichota bacterium]